MREGLRIEEQLRYFSDASCHQAKLMEYLASTAVLIWGHWPSVMRFVRRHCISDVETDHHRCRNDIRHSPTERMTPGKPNSQMSDGNRQIGSALQAATVTGSNGAD